MTLIEKISQHLLHQSKTLAVAESCTGGLLAKKLTDLSGSSGFFKIGVTSYSNESKTQILKVPIKIIDKHGAVSDQTAISMAKGVRKILKTDFGIAITGIAGPTGGTKTKPIGLVFIAVNTQQESLCLKCQFQGTRAQIRDQSANHALKLLLEFLI